MVTPSALELGAQNVVQSYLAARPGEVLVIVHNKAEELVGLLRRAASDADVSTDVISAEELSRMGQGLAGASVDRAMSRGGPVIWIAEPGLPNWVVHMVKNRANRHQCRHLHVPHADRRLFEQSIRAAPDELAAINQRVVRLLSAAATITVTSQAGTDLEIRLDPRFPLVELCGRPAPGETHWLPAGQVYTHPVSVTGTFVADRGVLIAGSSSERSIGRAHPGRFELTRGFVRAATCDIPSEQAALDEYFASDTHARRVASVIVPTNYLVRAEIGHRAQDGLLPGLNMNLGFADDATHAPFKTTVQMCLYARNLTVMADDRVLVQKGRFTPLVLQGESPFR
ncbi:MAG: hypothetical protein HOW73_12105 [Polyangiaceae bacterium]|nr:hypothetical protein [Polyangiaceae bacterium]